MTEPSTYELNRDVPELQIPVVEIGRQGERQIWDALDATSNIPFGSELNSALVSRFNALQTGREIGGQALRGWAEDPAHDASGALLISPVDGVTGMSSNERKRFGAAETLFVAHALGDNLVPWRRHYEQDGEPIQGVMPVEGHEDEVSSHGRPAQPGHVEMSPHDNGELVFPKFASLYGVTFAPDTPTSFFDAQAAISELPEDIIRILESKRFDYPGTALEQNYAGESGLSRPPLSIPVLRPTSAYGAKASHEIIADLDGETMYAREGDEEAAVALAAFKSAVEKHERWYEVREGELALWFNRIVMHGRPKEIQPGIKRSLIRALIGEVEHAGF